MSTYIVVVNRLGRAGVMVPTCLGEKCVYVLSLGMWLVIGWDFHLSMKWYLLFVLW